MVYEEDAWWHWSSADSHMLTFFSLKKCARYMPFIMDCDSPN